MALDGSGSAAGGIGGTLFGILDRVAGYKLIKENGLPYVLDGGRPVPVMTTGAPDKTEQTPPAPPGQPSALAGETFGVSNKTLAIGGAVALGLVALIAVTR